MGRSLQRDILVHPSQQRYHPYVNSPSPCTRIFEIACFVLILASVPAWLGGVYSIFVTGYGTALGLLGLLTYGTRRHSLTFLVFAILFFIFVIVVIILNAIDPIGKNLPFESDFYAPTGNTVAKRSFSKRQSADSTDSSYCSILAHCSLDIANLGQLNDGQIRLNYGDGAGPVSFNLRDGILYDNLNRTCYISGSTQLQCNYASQTGDFTQYCVANGSLTYAGSSRWWECNAGTGGSNVYTTKYYPQCTPIRLDVTTNNCTNTTTGAIYDGNAVTGGAFVADQPINGTNSTSSGGAAAALLAPAAGGVFVGSRIYAYIDSGIILLVTLIAIVAGFFVAGEFRPAPGTINQSSTTSTHSAPMSSAAAPAPGYVPAYAGGAPGYAIAPAVATAAAAAPLLAGGLPRDAPAYTSTAPAERTLSPNTVMAAANSAPVVYSNAPAGPAPASVVAAAAGVTAPLLAAPAAMAAGVPAYTSTAPAGRTLSPNTVMAAANSAPVVYSNAPAGPAPASVVGAAAGVTAPLLAAPAALLAAGATPVVTDGLSYGSYKTANTGGFTPGNEQFYTPASYSSPAVMTPAFIAPVAVAPVAVTTTTTTAVHGVPAFDSKIAATTPLLGEARREEEYYVNRI